MLVGRKTTADPLRLRFGMTKPAFVAPMACSVEQQIPFGFGQGRLFDFGRDDKSVWCSLGSAVSRCTLQNRRSLRYALRAPDRDDNKGVGLRGDAG
jgi:hypothetical protein